jgi:hypothetical protein
MEGQLVVDRIGLRRPIEYLEQARAFAGVEIVVGVHSAIALPEPIGEIFGWKDVVPDRGPERS